MSIVEEEGDDIKKECRVEDIEVLWTHGASLGEGEEREGRSQGREGERERERGREREKVASGERKVEIWLNVD